MTYYDADSDIAYIGLSDGAVARSSEYEWGLIDFASDGTPVGFEYWHASARLPAELLSVLPTPIRVPGPSVER